VKPRSRSSPSAPGTDSSILNENQRRHFEVFLERLEGTIDEVENLATHAPSRSDAVVTHDDDLSAEFSAGMSPLMGSLRQEIQALVELLDIPTRHRSITRLVRALLTAELVRADDSYARKLRGYGPVSPRAGDLIDPMIDAIRANLVRLLSLADAQSSSAAVPPAATSE
jgi:hypothetical protein